MGNSGFGMRGLAGTFVLAMACGESSPVEETADSSGSGADTSGASSATTVVTTADDGSGGTTGAGGTSDTGTDEDIVVVPLRIDAFNVPMIETYYACFEFTFTLDQLGQIVKFTPQVDNTSYVHHFVLTKLDAPSGQTNGYSCFDLSGEMVWTWAPGGQEWTLPPEAGFLIGDGPQGRVTFRLQIHYNNPLQTGGETDSSGLDLHVTKTLRPNNAGTMVFGDIEGIAIPPGESDYEYIATCHSSATTSLIPESMHVFGTAMHAHNIGKVLWSDVNRGGQFAYELNRDDPYLFNSQHMNPVDLVIEPGDEVVTHCIYDSSERTSPTLGGPGTSEEMCWNVVTYWPRVPNPLDVCTSFN